VISEVKDAIQKELWFVLVIIIDSAEMRTDPILPPEHLCFQILDLLSISTWISSLLQPYTELTWCLLNDWRIGNVNSHNSSIYKRRVGYIWVKMHPRVSLLFKNLPTSKLCEIMYYGDYKWNLRRKNKWKEWPEVKRRFRVGACQSAKVLGWADR